MTCQRPYCTEPATAYIPLPEGSHRTRVLLCVQHESEARTACYYVLSLANPESDEGFYRTVRAKHARIRGSDKLKFTKR